MTKDRKFDWKFCLCCGLFLWFVVNLLQGIFTEIQEDEAYYALFGEHLAWGYFDHPPMVGLMTFLSSVLFSGTLGVRFFTIIASCLSLLVIWLIAIDRPFDPSTSSGLKDLNPKSILLFFVIACSIVMFNIYGFVTTPDANLILFSAFFLLFYQRYLADKSWKNALLMGLFMALMVYSKYHAFLLLGLIVLSNLKLLKDGKFYIACLLALVLLMPHIMWQVNADFPSFRYHLSGRGEPFRWSYFFEYLPNQLLIFNPFTFGAIVYVLLKRGTREATQISNGIFERGLKFILIGFFFFFWLMAFRGHVEPHWTIVCVIPVVVLLYRNVLADDKLKKYIKWFILPSLLLVLAFRVILFTPLVDRYGYHGKEQYYDSVELAAGDCPVVFRGSFQEPALYHYFTGKESSTLRSYYDRKTQYDLWQFDTAWIDKPVYVGGIGLMKHFQSANRLVTDFQITNTETQPVILRTNDTIHFSFSIYNPCSHAIDFQDGMMLKLLLLDDNEIRYGHYDSIGMLQPKEAYRGRFSVVLGPQTRLGKNRLLLSIGDQIAIFADTKNAVEVIVDAP